MKVVLSPKAAKYLERLTDEEYALIAIGMAEYEANPESFVLLYDVG